jgi:ComF family protein
LEIYTPQGLCPTCLKYPIAFDSAWGAIHYNPASQRLLHLFKYQQKTSVRKIFRHFLSEFFERYQVPLNDFDCSIPIPLHPVRLRERGFNQSQLIAEIIQKDYGIPMMTEELVRLRPTEPQSFLGQKERWTNLEGAFTIKCSFNINSNSILLIDDLLTTGATASAAAQALKDAGATKVGLLVVAMAK